MQRHVTNRVQIVKATEVIPCIKSFELDVVISLLIVIIIFMSIGKGITASISAPLVALVLYAFGVGLQGFPLKL